MRRLNWPDQKDLSAQEKISPPRAWILAQDEQSRRRARASQPAPQRTRATRLTGRAPAVPRIKKRSRLRRRNDFQAAISGKRFHSGRSLVGFAVATNEDATRIGVTVSRTVKGSVERNRARRRVREVARLGWLSPDSPLRQVGIRYDVVLIARPAALEVEFADLKAEAALAALRLAKLRS